jgi:hypothetical protein
MTPMKRLVAVALVVTGMVPLALGQRGGARGGGGAGRGVTMSAPRGGFALSSRFSYTGARIGYSPAVSGRAYTSALPAFRAGSGVPVRRPVYGEPVRRRVPHLGVPYGVAVPYGVVGWVGPGYLDDSSSPVDAGAANYATSGAGTQPYTSPDGSGYPGGYGPPPVEQASVPPNSYPSPAYTPQPPPVDEESVTLVFKDGRAAEQIHNYILTPKTLFVQDEHHRIIPVDQLDLAATAKVNLDKGVVFQLPEARK